MSQTAQMFSCPNSHKAVFSYVSLQLRLSQTVVECSLQTSRPQEAQTTPLFLSLSHGHVAHFFGGSRVTNTWTMVDFQVTLKELLW